jgi:hypothetical protein
VIVRRKEFSLRKKRLTMKEKERRTLFGLGIEHGWPIMNHFLYLSGSAFIRVDISAKNAIDLNETSRPSPLTNLSMASFPFLLADTLYPCTHEPTKPMSVLALGLPRSGTDSLRHALPHLGFADCYHGQSTIPARDWLDCHALYRLLVRKIHTSQPAKFTTADFDAMLGDCMAATDLPAVMFATELLDAYPRAKVVLNRRYNVGAWKSSFYDTTLRAEESWFMWVVVFSSAELFWMERIFIIIINVVFKGDFERNAEEVYVRHYEELEAKLKEKGRRNLSWEVEEGWEPLCRFLGVDVLEVEFPRRNARVNHDEIIGALVKGRVMRAMLNMLMLLGGLVAVGAMTFYTR